MEQRGVGPLLTWILYGIKAEHAVPGQSVRTALAFKRAARRALRGAPLLLGTSAGS